MTQTLAEAAWEHYAAHQSRTWCCPLCEFATTAPLTRRLSRISEHAAKAHPAFLPVRRDDGKPLTTADMLDSLPALVREAWLTMRTSADLWTIIELDPRDARVYPKAMVARLVECERIVHDAMDEQTRANHPYQQGAPNWRDELAWLRGAWSDAQAFLDPADEAWIADEVRAIRSTLGALARVRPRPRLVCPDCSAPMHMSEDGSDWLVCDAGHQQPGPKRLEKQWRRKPPMPTKAICEQLRVPRRTLMWWQSEGRITPTRTEGKTSYWLPWDVIAIRYPDIVAEIDARDSAA